jgi:hypothetical protein
MSVRRKCAELLQYFNPFSTNLESPPPPLQDEALPARKRPRLETSTSVSRAADVDEDADIFVDAVRTASPDDTVAVAPTYAVTAGMAASLPRAGDSHMRARNCKWRPEEDRKLTDAVRKFGQVWVRVSALVPGRTSAQCSVRWRKHLDLPTNITNDQKSPQKFIKWTPEEDAKVIAGVREIGKDWLRVATLVPGRTNDQCCRRWIHKLNPDIKSGKWTEEEDEKLTDAVTQFGSNWGQVSALVPGRTNAQCSARWCKHLDASISKWTRKEDAKLMDAIEQVGTDDWAKVAVLIPGRTDDECCKRWAKSLGPGINKGIWTLEEDRMLIAAVLKFGNNCWVTVATLVPGRTNAQCSARWRTQLAAKAERIYGVALIPGRTEEECCKRWAKSLGPGIIKGIWTLEEDRMLMAAVLKFGNNCWVTVATLVPGRTNIQCSARWRTQLAAKAERIYGVPHGGGIIWPPP